MFSIVHTCEGWIVEFAPRGTVLMRTAPVVSLVEAQRDLRFYEESYADATDPSLDDLPCGGTHANPCSEMCLACH